MSYDSGPIRFEANPASRFLKLSCDNALLDGAAVDFTTQHSGESGNFFDLYTGTGFV